MPTKESEFWAVLKGLPKSLQFILIVLLLSNVVSIPANLDSLVNTSPTIQNIKIQVDTARARLYRLEVKNTSNSMMIDTIAVRLLMQEDKVDFLWCMNERGFTSEIREFCNEVREATREAQMGRLRR